MTVRLPNFLFIGPDKTGSSWLFELLRVHPRCFVPDFKDIYFFDRYYDRGLDWYRSFFRHAAPDAVAVGELSHDYLFSPAAAGRIARDLPGVRLLTCLRDPVERTFSHYLYMVRSGRTRLAFEPALEEFPELIGNSLYHRHLAVYFAQFPPERIKVLWFEELQRDTPGFAGQVFDFLDLPRQSGQALPGVVRAAAAPRSHALARLMKHGANWARVLGLPNLVGTVKHSHLAQLLYKRYDVRSRPAPDPRTRARLQARFAEDVAALERLLGVDLAHWNCRDGGRA